MMIMAMTTMMSMTVTMIETTMMMMTVTMSAQILAFLKHFAA